MASSTPQKFRERLFVTSGLDRMGLKDSAANLTEGESPDFGLRVDGRTIGIEVTEFFYPEVDARAPRQFQILRDKAVQMARCKFRAHGGPPLNVVPVFQEHPAPCGPTTRREIEDFAERFQRTVFAHGWDIGIYHDWVFKNPSGVPEIEYYFVHEAHDEDGELWGRAGPSNGLFVEPRHVQDELDRKAPKHRDYLDRCDAVWLLIANSGALRTAPCELGVDARTASYTFPFERVLWVDVFPVGPVVSLNRVGQI